VVAVLICVALAGVLAGCGGGNSFLHRPKHPIWCPRTPPEASERLRRSEAQTRFDARSLVGIKLDEASDLAKLHDCSVRVTARNGTGLLVDANLDYHRIDVKVLGDVIVAVTDVG
jgi:hypothetical protein